MPFKSKSQMRRLMVLKGQGKISQQIYDKFVEGTEIGKLPERVEKSPKSNSVKIKPVREAKVK